MCGQITCFFKGDVCDACLVPDSWISAAREDYAISPIRRLGSWVSFHLLWPQANACYKVDRLVLQAQSPCKNAAQRQEAVGFRAARAELAELIGKTVESSGIPRPGQLIPGRVNSNSSDLSMENQGNEILLLLCHHFSVSGEATSLSPDDLEGE